MLLMSPNGKDIDMSAGRVAASDMGFHANLPPLLVTLGLDVMRLTRAER